MKIAQFNFRCMFQVIYLMKIAQLKIDWFDMILNT